MKLIQHDILPKKGALWCGSMPGYSSGQEREEIQNLKDKGVEAVVCLMRDAEIARKSPGLLNLYKEAELEVIKYGIEDFSVPNDREGLRNLVEDMLSRLARGQKIFMHCYAGIGRTGTVLACLLKRAGLQADPVGEARAIYSSGALESLAQQDFVRSFKP